MSGPAQTYPVHGELRPILVDPLGEPVVDVWISPDEKIRWYIVPDDIDWNTSIDWLVHQAIPAYAPQAARRYRTSSFVDADLVTPAERYAQQALADMENRHAEERQRLQADLDRARQNADPIRDGLFYGKHLRTWPELRPELPVGGGALVVNHQHRLPPNERTRAIYSRREFVATLTVPVIAVHDLFGHWKTSEWTAVQRTILGTEPPAIVETPPSSTAEQSHGDERTRRRIGWGFGRRR